MRNQTTFSGFVDVYNVGKEEINGRELYIKRFEDLVHMEIKMLVLEIRPFREEACR